MIPLEYNLEGIIMKKEAIIALALKLTQVTALLTGVLLTSYNIFSFKVARNGYYFNDDNQTWLAVGVGFLTLAYTIKNWNKI